MRHQRRPSISTGIALFVSLIGVFLAANWALAGPPRENRHDMNDASAAAVLEEIRMLRLEVGSLRAQLTASTEAARVAAQSLDSEVRAIRSQSATNPLDMTVQLCASNDVVATRREGIHLQGGVGHTANIGLIGEATAAFEIDGGAGTDVSITACLKDRDYRFDTKDLLGKSNQEWLQNTFRDTGRVLIVNKLRNHLIDAVRYRDLTLETLLGNVDVFLDEPKEIDQVGANSDDGLTPAGERVLVRTASWTPPQAQSQAMEVWDRLGAAGVGPLPGGIQPFSLESFGKRPVCPPRVCAGIDSMIGRVGILGAADRELKNAVGSMKVAVNVMCSGINSAFGAIRATNLTSPGVPMDLGSWRVVTNIGLTPTMGPKIVGVRPIVGIKANPTFATIGVGRRVIGGFSLSPFQGLPPEICQPIQ